MVVNGIVGYPRHVSAEAADLSQSIFAFFLDVPIGYEGNVVYF